MPGTKRSAILLAVLAVAAAFATYWRNGTPSGPVKDLPHLESVIDTSRHTYDPIPSDLYVRASRALEAGATKAAEALYREAISKYPNDPDGYAALGACLFGQHRYEEAE